MQPIYEKARFNVTKNILIFTFVSLSLLTVFNLITKGANLISTSTGAIFSFIVLVYLFKSNTYKLPAFTALILGYLLNLYNLFGESNFENYIDFFWTINLVLFTHFTLGRKIGNIYFLLNMLTLITVSIFHKMEFISLRPASNIYNTYTYIDFSLNFFVCSLFFGYLINQFFKQSQKAQNDAISINEKLENNNIELQKQYDEKSIMLKEIHHRVKNNLQVITSLLRLQLYKIEDNKAREPFDESISRINAMALIHEQMYKGDQVKNLNLGQYIKELGNNLILNYTQQKQVEFDINSDIKTLDLDTVVPFSLILNELISNSLKHAFADILGKGKIKINITKKNKSINFIYQDNGNWKTPKMEYTFGLELIETFTEQLGGTYTIDTSKGTKYIFVFETQN
ncbi:MAG TPA: sensor histidine kinase [Crocinitomix sp.]|nr:sensor histidine kinase [Crocinitomix sp.]